VEIVSHIKRFDFVTALFLQLTGQLLGQRDVCALRAFVAAAKQDHDLFSALNEIDPIAGAVMYSHFADAVTDRLHVTRGRVIRPSDIRFIKTECDL
jgi:hypothetical protein